jgi:hypothetical protein
MSSKRRNMEHTFLVEITLEPNEQLGRDNLQPNLIADQLSTSRITRARPHPCVLLGNVILAYPNLFALSHRFSRVDPYPDGL